MVAYARAKTAMKLVYNETDRFHIVLFPDLHKLTVLYNKHFLTLSTWREKNIKGNMVRKAVHKYYMQQLTLYNTNNVYVYE